MFVCRECVNRFLKGVNVDLCVCVWGSVCRCVGGSKFVFVLWVSMEV